MVLMNDKSKPVKVANATKQWGKFSDSMRREETLFKMESHLILRCYRLGYLKATTKEKSKKKKE